MVSTQTTLTCSRSDNLLPHSLLYNIITSKLTEAFELTSYHAAVCDYKDNINYIKKEPGYLSYRFTNKFPESPDLDLSASIIPEIQEQYSPVKYIPQKRQRLNSVSSPVNPSMQELLGLKTQKTKYSCSNCNSTYPTSRILANHTRRCKEMVYVTPLTETACAELKLDASVHEQDAEDTCSGDQKTQVVQCSNESTSEIKTLNLGDKKSQNHSMHQDSKICGSEKKNSPPLKMSSKMNTDPEICYLKPVRRSNRDCKKTKRQLVSKILLEKIKGINKNNQKIRDNTSDKIPNKSMARRKTVSGERLCSQTAAKKVKVSTDISLKVKNANKKAKNVTCLEEIEKNEVLSLCDELDVSNNQTREMGPDTKFTKATDVKHLSLKEKDIESERKSSDIAPIQENSAPNRKDTSKSDLNIKKEEILDNNDGVKFSVPDTNPIVPLLPPKKLLESSKDAPPTMFTKAETTSEELTTCPVEAKYHCAHCRCKFQSLWSARRHNYTVHGIGTPLTSDDLLARQSGTVCPICTDSGVDDRQPNIEPEDNMDINAAIKLMEEGNSSSLWVCGVCGRSFDERLPLVEHRKKHAGVDPPKPQPSGLFKCMVCGAVHPTHSNLMKHIDKLHNPALTCDTCYQLFPSTFQLKSHNCGSDVLISCRHCPKKFKSSSAHIKHMKMSHSSLTMKLEESACKLCDYTFSSVIKYKVHQSVAHPSPDVKCKVCNLDFKSRERLICHILSDHKEVRPFLCTVCEEGFTSNEDLVAHRSLHFK